MPTLRSTQRAARSLLLTLAVAATSFTLPAHADISAASTKASSLTNLNMVDDATTVTLSRQARLEQEIADLKTEAALMRAKLDANDITVTEASYNLLLQQIADKQAALDAYNNALAESSSSSNSLSNSGGGSSGSSSSGSGGKNNLLSNPLVQGMMQGAMGNLMGGMQGGNIQGIAQNLGQQVASLGNPGNATTTPSRAHAGSPTKADPKKDDDAKPTCDDPEAGKGVSSGGKATTESSPGKAADDDLTSGGKVKPKEKPKCEIVDYGTKDPTGKGTPKHITDFKNIADVRAYIAAHLGECTGKNCECASLVKELAGLPATSTWRQGDPVTKDTPFGTPIATFNNGDKYGTNASPGGASGFSHTAIYLWTNPDGSLHVMDQYNGSSNKERDLKCNGGLEGCNMYSTINTSRAFLQTIPILQPVWLALNNLLPFGMGLLKS